MGSTPGEMVAVLGASLVWLALLTFPVAHALTAASPAAELVAATAALLLLALVYIGAAITAARHGPPRSAPVSTAVVGAIAVVLPLAGPEWIGATVFLAALFGLTLPARRALAASIAAAGLAAGQALLGGAPAAQALAVPLVTAVAGVVVVVVVRQVTLSRELAASRRAVAAAAAQDERLRLARELHDSVKQQAFVAALEIGSARTRLGADPHLTAAADAVAAVQRELGEVIEHLRPTGQEPLVPALRRHVERWSLRTGVRAELVVEGDPEMPAEPMLTVATEALTNVARHAGASRIRLVLRAADGEACLVVEDDGRGFDPGATPRGHGLRGMAERLAQHGGDLDVRPGARGTTVIARYPRPS